MEIIKVILSLSISVMLMRFQPKSNNEQMIFVALIFAISFIITKDLRSSTLIVVIAYLLSNIITNNIKSIRGLLKANKEGFNSSDDSDDSSEESGEESDGSETGDSGEESDESDDSGEESDDSEDE